MSDEVIFPQSEASLREPALDSCTDFDGHPDCALGAECQAGRSKGLGRKAFQVQSASSR